MRSWFAAAFLAAAVMVAPAWSQDFSITNTVQPADQGRRDLIRQLQAWWDVHAYYPRDASASDQEGSVQLHLAIHPDGIIWMADVAAGSGSRALDTAAAAAFRGGFVRPFPPDAPETGLDISLHYVLAHPDNQPAASKRPFTISNDPVKSTVFETMLQRTCTGTVVKDGWRNHPIYGSRFAATAIFFRKPDGTPWVRFWEGGFLVAAPVTERGKLAQWTGRPERIGRAPPEIRHTRYTVWPDGDNRLSGDTADPPGTVDFTCATEIVPAITSNALLEAPSPKNAAEEGDR